jgi:hypothetical protein
MTDTTNEDKEIERIARITVMNGLLARTIHAEAERDRLEAALRHIKATLALDGVTVSGVMGDALKGSLIEVARTALKETDHD